jgi:hypothetical protein
MTREGQAGSIDKGGCDRNRTKSQDAFDQARRRVDDDALRGPMRRYCRRRLQYLSERRSVLKREEKHDKKPEWLCVELERCYLLC